MKQKLVDVDKIKNKYNDNWPSEIAEGFQMAIDAIEDAPIVDAIPIEWINSYTTGLIFSDEYVDNADSIDYYIDCINEMVRDWKKENE